MRHGDARGRSAWLLFLHADTELPRGWLARIPELDCEAGAFRHRFADPDWKLRLLSWANTQRSRITRIFYGDQAIFVRAPLFRAVTPARLLDAHVQTSPRKFRRLGVLRATAMCLELLARHALRRPLAGHRFFREVR